MAENDVRQKVLKKIYQSLDFIGNRIKRLRVDTPVESEVPYIKDIETGENIREEDDKNYNESKDFVANKEYVDVKTTYDTVKAKTYKNPFKIWWMKNVYGLSYKKLLDDLLFPRLTPEYIKPKVTDVKLTVFNSKLVNVDNFNNITNKPKANSIDNKYIIWLNQNNSIQLNIKLDKGDWTGIDSSGYLVVKKDDNEEIIFTSESKNNEESVIITNNFEYKRGWKLLYRREYKPNGIDKQDTYGDNSENPEQTYTLEYDLTELFESQVIIYDNFLLYKNTNEISISTNPNDYNYSNKITYNTKTEEQASYDIAIPQNIIKTNNIINYFITATSDKTFIAEGKLYFKDLKMTVTFDKNEIPYFAGHYNFGSFDENVDIMLYPEFRINKK